MTKKKSKISSAAYKQLEGIVGPDHITDAIEDRICYSYDGTKQKALPDAVVKPATAQEISEILKVADAGEIPVTARGAGSGLTGGSVPLHGGLVLDFQRMNRIVEINKVDMLAVVEPGVVMGHFQAEAEKQGLFYPPDPASADVATMGGSVAECAGGLRGLKYGVTKDYVIALEIVLANGDIIHTGARTYKSVTGYDMTKLLVGSEGTLGIITQITVRLIPLPASLRSVVALFDDTNQATDAAMRICEEGIVPRALEFMDGPAIAAVRDYIQVDVPAATEAILFSDVDGADITTEQEQNRICEICTDAGAAETRTAAGPQEREKLWEIRKSISPALYKIAPNKLNHDVCVPRSKVRALMRWLDAVVEEATVPVIRFAHIGDGNIHVNFMFDHSDKQKAEAERLSKKLFKKVINDFQGTLTGEHGVGNRKSKYLPIEIPPRELKLMKEIKDLLDPKGILNPGKMFWP
ncbi:MAG: FAD-binding protein [Planctomycetes bacterium]|nr:FAD-binding protein [Planctomycetota bacterium]